MLYFGVPVIDQHRLTWELLESMKTTVADPDQLKVILFDNASEEPYGALPWEKSGQWPFAVAVIRNKANEGYYRPINDLGHLLATPADLVALCHNDLYFYEKGWDRRLRECFVRDGRLGMVGFCGSNEVDDRGGRGGGTMVNFRGEKGASTEATGKRVTGLAPALVFDSLFMVMRQPIVQCLGVDEHFQLCHFGDRVWPLRAIEHEWRVGVLGIEIDHIGGQTAVLNAARIDLDYLNWLNQEKVEIQLGQSVGLAAYLEAERRYLSEYRDTKHLIPARMNGWLIQPMARV